MSGNSKFYHWSRGPNRKRSSGLRWFSARVFAFALAATSCGGKDDARIDIPPRTFRQSDLEIAALLASAAEEGKAIRARFDLEHRLDPDAPALLAAMDASVQALVTPPLPSSPGRVVPVEKSVGSADAAGIPNPANVFVLPMVVAMQIAEAALEASSGTSHTTADTQTIGLETSTGTLTSNAMESAVFVGSQLTVDVKLTMKGEATDASTGVTRFRIVGEGSAHIEMNACPDASGIAAMKVRIQGREDYFIGASVGSVGFGLTRDLAGEGRLKVDDDARLVRIDAELTGDESIKGGGTSGRFAHDVGVRMSGSWLPGGTDWVAGSETGNVTHNDGASWEEILSLARNTGDPLSVMLFAGQAAEKFWRAGKCVEVLVDPDGGEVDPGSRTDVTARVRHRFVGNDLNKPVEATLAGVQSLEPAGRKQPAPATVVYTAGAREHDTGDLTFRTVSNRGIGETTVKFVARRITFTGTTHAANALWRTVAQVTWTPGITMDNVVEYRPSGTVTITPVPSNPCTIVPAEGIIRPDDGWLRIDYNVNPPTYRGSGLTSWPANWECPTAPPQPADAPAFFLGGGISGEGATGTVGTDGVISGSDTAFFGIAAIEYHWSFTRD